MSLRARTKFVAENKPAVRAGVTLFCDRDSLQSHWVRLVLMEKDVDGARIEWVSANKPHEDLLILNPELTLPTLIDRDTVIHPASVIAQYLDERYPIPRLMPSDPAVRARLRMVLARLENDLFPMAGFILAGKGDVKTARKTLTEHLITSAKLCPPARGWFMGLDYNLVDCAWAVLLYRLGSLNLKLPNDVAPLVRYAERLFARPAFQKTLR